MGTERSLVVRCVAGYDLSENILVRHAADCRLFHYLSRGQRHFISDFKIVQASSKFVYSALNEGNTAVKR